MKDEQIFKIVSMVGKLLELNGFTSIMLLVLIFGTYMLNVYGLMFFFLGGFIGRNVAFIEVMYDFYKKEE